MTRSPPRLGPDVESRPGTEAAPGRRDILGAGVGGDIQGELPSMTAFEAWHVSCGRRTR
jgi:hypothetical protein